MSDSDCDSSSDEQVLDETLDNQIEESTKQLENLEHPEEINVNPSFDQDFMGKFFEQIKSMPRDKAIQLLANLAKDNKVPEHKFTSVSEEKRVQNVRNLRDKIKELKLRRSSKVILANYEEKIKEKFQNKEPVVEPVVEPVTDSVTLSKSQKKRRRRATNKKLKQDT